MNSFNEDYMGQLHNARSSFKVVANFYGSSNTYEEVDAISWPGGRTEAPPDSPFCGFDNENPDCNKGDVTIIPTTLMSIKLT